MQAKKKQTWQQPFTLSPYVELRNGVPLGDSNLLPNRLHRSLGAASFAGFGQYWSPIWGYGRGKYAYAPARPMLPPAVAILLTFLVSGAIHDLATMAVSRSFAFLFTPWFFLLGVGAVLGRVGGMDVGKRPFWQRATANLIYLVTCLLLALMAKRMLLI